MVVVLLIGGAVTAVVGARHYSEAPQLECSCGLVWAAPDDVHEQVTSDQMAVFAARRRQAFKVLIVNPSTVTQTVLALASNQGLGIRPALLMGPGNPTKGFVGASVSRRPLTLKPNQLGVLQVELGRICLQKGTSEAWGDVAVRVRVGAFVRTETIDFGGTSMALDGVREHQFCAR